MKSILGALAALTIALGAMAVSPGPETASAETISLNVALAGANEVPPVTSGGAGQANLTFDTDTNMLVYVVSVSGIAQDQVTAAHIHRGVAGENGPVAYTLSDTGFVQVTGSVELSQEDVDAFFAGGLYINVHSVDNPDGFVRGQILPPEGSAPDDEDEMEADGTPEAGATAVPDEPGPVTPPATGDAGLATSSGSSALLAGAFLIALLGVASGATVLRHRA